MTEYLNHPLLKKDTIERRKYQENIIASCSNKNSLVVLPTGIGKTIIAIGIVAHRLGKYKDKKALIMAPTKPLVEQHLKSFSDVMDIETGDIGNFEILTGKVPPKKREDIYKTSRIIFATPQVIENDIMKNTIDLSQFSIIVFDEAHRTSGDYAYTFIAKRYIETPQKEQLILGLTASPGGTKEKIGAICGNLYCENVEIRDENDWDVKPYIKETKIDWVKITFPDEFKKISRYLETAKKKRIKFLISMNILTDTQPSKRELLELSGKMRGLAVKKQDPIFFKAISDVAACIKLNHAIELIQTQGIPQLETYIEKLKKDRTKASMTLLSDDDVKQASILTTYLASKDTKHPKLIKAKELAIESIKGDKKTIIFAHYINTVDLIIKELADEKTLKPVRFIGQRKGNTQKKQKETLDKFRDGTYNILVATSVAEEGLDIPKVDTVIFYEPIPSEIRTIQRRGRTGREKEGKVHILMTKGTIDEAYYWSTRHKERKMKIVIDSLKKNFNKTGIEIKTNKAQKEQKSLKSFKRDKDRDNNKIKIYVDHREPKLIKKLTETDNTEIISKQLAVGDVIVSDRVGIERKEVGDFLQSIIDKRLFTQMTELKETFERPILIIEGKNLYGIRNMHPNAIRGALASIACDFSIPVIPTRDIEDTKDMVIALARREQGEKREISLRGTKRSKTKKEMQEYIISGFPDINIKLSRRILERFGTIKRFINCKEKTLEEIEGLGKEKAKKIKDIVETDYNKTD
ncbi:MAG: DEAD/DEAH box helicase family protein [Candidatus Aenigmarchaeota archaeon]|nr:DEAD/DEAH box helicase family protein [Candidatus Aenigmarchaeota archaeon]